MDSSAWNDRYGSEEFVWKVEPNQFVVAEVSPLKVGRALDVACGEGRNAVWLARHGWRTLGVDFSSVGLDKARRLAESVDVDVEWLEADVRTWQPEPQSFDLVLLAYVHLPPEERTPMHRAMAGAVAPDGTLLLIAHDSTNLTEGYGGPQDPDLLFTPDDVVEELAGLGLEVARASRVHRSVPTPSGEVTAVDSLVILRRPLEA